MQIRDSPQNYFGILSIQNPFGQVALSLFLVSIAYTGRVKKVMNKKITLIILTLLRIPKDSSSID